MAFCDAAVPLAPPLCGVEGVCGVVDACGIEGACGVVGVCVVVGACGVVGVCGGVGACGVVGVCGAEHFLALLFLARPTRSASARCARSSVDADASTWSPSSTKDTCGVLGIVLGVVMGVVVGVGASPTFARARKGGAPASEVIDIWPLPTR